MIDQYRLAEAVKHVNHIAPASRTAGTVNGSAIDTAGYDAAMFAVNAGAIGGATGLDVKIQESDDQASWSDISGAAIAQLGENDDNQAPLIDVALGGAYNRKRYLRAVATVAGGSSVVYGVSCELYRAHQVPQTQSPAAVIV